jgi:hypothetical protein
MGGRLWRHPDFLKLWGGQTVSQLGTQLALPTAAIMLLGAGPEQLGLVVAAEFLAFPVLGLFAGVWADRLPRRRIMAVCDVGRLLALASIPTAYAAGGLTMAQLYVVALVMGVGSVFFDVSYQAYLPALVPADDLREGNAKLEIGRSSAYALVRKGHRLAETGSPADAMRLYDEVPGRFGDNDGSPLAGPVSLALRLEAEALRKVGRPWDAVAAEDEVIRRFGGRSDPRCAAPSSGRVRRGAGRWAAWSGDRRRGLPRRGRSRADRPHLPGRAGRPRGSGRRARVLDSPQALHSTAKRLPFDSIVWRGTRR